jgi:hypothetical protein
VQWVESIAKSQKSVENSTKVQHIPFLCFGHFDDDTPTLAMWSLHTSAITEISFSSSKAAEAVVIAASLLVVLMVIASSWFLT